MRQFLFLLTVASASLAMNAAEPANLINGDFKLNVKSEKISTARMALSGNETKMQTLRQTSANDECKRASRQNIMKYSGIIEDVPGSTPLLYELASYNFYEVGQFQVMFTARDCMPREVVRTESAMYLKNPVTGFKTNSYLKVEKKEDGRYVANLPAPIYMVTDDEGKEYIFNLKVLEKQVDEWGDVYYTPTTQSEVEFRYADGNIWLDMGYVPSADEWGYLEYPEKILGIVNENDAWIGFGDATQQWIAFTTQPTVAPSDLQTEEWTMTFDGDGQKVQVGFDGNDVWISGLVPAMGQNWIKGIVEGNRIRIDSDQYMGLWSDAFIYYINMAMEFDPGSGYITRAEVIPTVYFNYDKERKTFSADIPEFFMMPNGGLNRVNYAALYEDPVFLLQPDNIDQTPLAPFNLDVYEDAFELFGQIIFSFSISKLNKDGYLLDPSTLFYRIYFDENLKTFEGKDYRHDEIGETITDIPVTYDGVDFYCGGVNGQVIIKDNSMNALGVQLINKIDGKTYESPIVYSELQNASVEDVVEVKPITGEKWYDLTGREVASPSKGVFIHRIEYSDGSAKVEKILK